MNKAAYNLILNPLLSSNSNHESNVNHKKKKSVTLDWNKHMFAEIPAQFFKDFSNYSDEIPGKIKAIDKYVSLGSIIMMEQENGFKEEKKFYKVH